MLVPIILSNLFSYPAHKELFTFSSIADRQYQYKQLVEAARMGDVTKIESLIKMGSPVNSLGRFPGNGTPLGQAICKGCFDAIKTLLHHGARFDVDDNDEKGGLNPLSCILIMDNKNLIGTMYKFLIKRGLDVRTEAPRCIANPLLMCQLERAPIEIYNSLMNAGIEYYWADLSHQISMQDYFHYLYQTSDTIQVIPYANAWHANLARKGIHLPPYQWTKRREQVTKQMRESTCEMDLRRDINR